MTFSLWTLLDTEVYDGNVVLNNTVGSLTQTMRSQKHFKFNKEIVCCENALLLLTNPNLYATLNLSNN